jgi:hypothetical protein
MEDITKLMHVSMAHMQKRALPQQKTQKKAPRSGGAFCNLVLGPFYFDW